MDAKPGYLTTEFWISVAVITLTAFLGAIDVTNLPAAASAGVVALTAAAYAISRGLAKEGVPFEVPGDPSLGAYGGGEPNVEDLNENETR